jgi:hypothetical protein
MPRFEVQITDKPPVVDIPSAEDMAMSSFVRDSYWTGEATDRETAVECAWEAWDEKYGPGQRPAEPVIRAT